MSHSIQTVLALAIALQVPPASAGAAIGCQADLADLAGFMKANDAGAEAHLSSHREAIA